MKKVFLGGTCNNSQWREALIPTLKIAYHNPVVKDWTPAHEAVSIVQRQTCDYCLYVITPLMVGALAVAEVADDSNKRPEKTVFCYLDTDQNSDGETVTFGPHQLKSLTAAGNMIQENGAKWCKSLEEVAEYLNK